MRRRDQRGSLSLELVVLTPVLVGCILTIAGGARFVAATDHVSLAATAAARAASLESSRTAALTAGRAAGRAALADQGQSCAQLEITLVIRNFAPGETVRARVTCRTNLDDLVGFGLPGTREFSDEAVVPLEQHRVIP